jgi:hypothetical protein
MKTTITSNQRIDVYSRVTERIVADLERGPAAAGPWRGRRPANTAHMVESSGRGNGRIGIPGGYWTLGPGARRPRLTGHGAI